MSRAVEPVNASLDELVAAAKRTDRLVFCDREVTSRNFPETGIRGQLVLLSPAELRLGSLFSAFDVELAITAIGHLPAIMLELVYYLEHGWDGAASVAALGSSWQAPSGELYAGYLNAIPGIPRLNLAKLEYDWDHHDSFLTVRP